MSLFTNLRASYKLNESSGNAVDSSGNAYTLTNTGTVTYATGLVGNCAQFGATNTTKKLTSGNNLGITNPASDWSISYWWRNSAVNIIDGVFGFTYGIGTNYFSGIYDGANTRYLFKSPSGTATIGSSASINTWYNVTIVNSSGLATIYVNGSSIGTLSTVTTTTSLSDNFELGFNTNGLTNFGAGDIDIVMVWNRALSGAEVTSIYNGGSAKEYSNYADTESVTTTDVPSYAQSSSINDSISTSDTPFYSTNRFVGNLTKSSTTWTTLTKSL